MVDQTRRRMLSAALFGFPLSLFAADTSLAGPGKAARKAARRKKKALGRLKRKLKTKNGRNAWYVFKFQHFIGKVTPSDSGRSRSVRIQSRTTTRWKKVQGVDAAAELVYAFLSDRTPGVKNFDFRSFLSQAEADVFYSRVAPMQKK